MKNVMIGMMLMLGVNTSFAANFASVIKLLGYSESVIELEKEMDNKGLSLLSVKDLFLESGVRPRCPCDKYEVTFKGSGEIRTFVIQSEGFMEKIVTIKEQ